MDRTFRRAREIASAIKDPPSAFHRNGKERSSDPLVIEAGLSQILPEITYRCIGSLILAGVNREHSTTVSAFEALTNTLFRLPCGSKDARWIVHSGSIFGNFEDSPIKRRGLCPHFRLPVENHKKYANEAAKQIGERAHFGPSE